MLAKINYDVNNIFAKIIRGEIPSFKIYEDDYVLVIMDIMPESRGHTLVITKEAAPTLFDLSKEGLQHCMNVVKKVAPALMQATQADGMQFKQYNHECAGQTIFQVHFHLVPCYQNQNHEAHARTQADMKEIEALAQKIKQTLETF